jgi:hypothetical protein
MHDSEQPEGRALTGETPDQDPAMVAVPRTIGTTIGSIASSSAKALGTPTTKLRSKSREASVTREAEILSSTGEKLAQQRKSLMKKKRQAHRLKVKRSHTKG